MASSIPTEYSVCATDQSPLESCRPLAAEAVQGTRGRRSIQARDSTHESGLDVRGLRHRFDCIFLYLGESHWCMSGGYGVYEPF